MNILQHCNALQHLPFEFAPNIWNNNLDANCYEYLLNFRNSYNPPLTVGSVINYKFEPFYSNQDLVSILQEELHALGFSMEETNNSNNVRNNKLKFFLSRSRCGDYHFYRLDSNSEWSHKFSFSFPSNLDFSGNKIILP